MSDTPHAPAPDLSTPASVPAAVPEADEHRRVEELAAHAAKEGVRTGPFASLGGIGGIGGIGGLGGGAGGGRGAGALRHLALVIALGILCAIGAVTKGSSFATTSNMVLILSLAAVIGVVTVGMTFVIIGGGIDLSVGALIALASVWSTTTGSQAQGPAVMIFTSVLVGTLCGLLNGLLIAYGRLVAFIVTLATMVATRGLAEQLSDRKSQIVTADTFLSIAETRWLGMPLLVYIFAAVVVLGWLVLNRTTFGRRTFAVGGNPEAARLAGINVRLHTCLLYVVSGFCCGIAAVMLTAQANTGASTHGMLYELNAIAAVVVGGTLLTGGFGSVLGSILGVLVFTTITDLFILNNLTTPIQEIAQGAIIIAVLLIQRWGRGRSVTT
ncbi:ABC transporter permease [Streptomyces sp. RKAG293]|uniref:ABC transporter permease n=1 Tax=Streptomyces sp. RKAG293 TaxID=2893403 RepID=UPI00203364E2|nr:ABC transporter permease [Streptomyces sp. RKAG293]MCM2423463.1 ABC transporter permease [Streptomyces sp. RKAG293]